MTPRAKQHNIVWPLTARTAENIDANFNILFQDLALLAQWIRTGAGSPEGVVAAPVGTLYLRTDGATGSTVYVKETGASVVGWIAK